MKLQPVNCAAVSAFLEGFLRKTFREKGFSRAILGISGGLDSSVSAALCCRALGAANVIGVILPAGETAGESVSLAEEFGRSLGITLRTVSIQPQLDAYFNRFPDADRLRRGNKAARERMAVLYDLSAAHQALVVGTSNRSELFLGYGTLHGDIACAVNPLGGLFKTEVRQIAEFLGIPESIRTRPPSADLWPGQTDEGELGLSYEHADVVLHCLLDRRLPPDRIARESGLPQSVVDLVVAKVAASEFKRSLPVIAEVPDSVKYAGTAQWRR